MTAIQAVYDGTVFIPEKPCNITKGTKVKLIVEAEMHKMTREEILAGLERLNEEIMESNKIDPLPDDFEEMLSQNRVRFREIDVS